MHFFIGFKSVFMVDTSNDRVEQVVPSHLEARICGNIVEAP